MCTHLRTLARHAAVIVLLLCATSGRAQSTEGAGTNQPEESRTTLHILLGAQAVLLAADMVSTAHALHLGGGAREGNPLLRPFSGHPLALAAAMGAVSVLQTYTIVKLHRRHPKIARGWALALVGLQSYAVTNNIRAAGRIRRANAAGR
jgi:hypothetical protein